MTAGRAHRSAARWANISDLRAERQTRTTKAFVSFVHPSEKKKINQLILLKLGGSGASHVNKITAEVQTGKPLT